MLFEKRQEVHPENVLLGDSEPVDDLKASEILFVDIEARDRRRDFLRGVMAGAVIAIALCVGVILWRVSSVRDELSLDVLKSSLEKCVELTRMQSNFEFLVDYRQGSKQGRPRNYAVMVNGNVESGFDMSKARIEVFRAERRVEVTLPHGKIERTVLNLRKGSEVGVRVYDPRGEVSMRTFSAKEESEILSVAMRTVRSRASGEWGVVSRVEENAEKVYGVVLGALRCEVRVSFTDEATKLGMPEGVSGEELKGGGAFIVHTEAKRANPLPQ